MKFTGRPTLFSTSKFTWHSDILSSLKSTLHVTVVLPNYSKLETNIKLIHFLCYLPFLSTKLKKNKEDKLQSVNQIEEDLEV